MSQYQGFQSVPVGKHQDTEGGLHLKVAEGDACVLLKQGDITLEQVDAIVNAANSSLLGGGGVDGAIHRAGGPKILEECQRIRDSHGPCATGEAVITSAGDLMARYVIHAVGPIWSGGKAGEAELLRSAYYEALVLARAHNCQSVAFPAISAGAYGYPLLEASKIAVGTVVDFLEVFTEPQEVRFVLYSAPILEAFKQALQDCGHTEDRG